MKPQSNLRAMLYLAILAMSSFLNSVSAQKIGEFTTVTPTAQTQGFVIPSSHRFQRIIKTGDALSMGGTFGNNPDFTGYVPIAGSSFNGRLAISGETTTAEASVLDVSYSFSTHRWSVTAGGKVNFNPTEIGTVRRFCSGTVTPNGTVIVSEEDLTAGNVNSGVDGYQDAGWLIEYNPATRTVINQTGGNPNADKLWALGRASRGNAAIKSDNSVLYTGADMSSNGYVYKFVPTVPGVWSAGQLYVLRTTAGLGNGTWKLVPNSTIAEREALVTNAAAAPAAYNFNGVEDIEISPIDGKVYFSAKNEGKVYRFTDNNTVGTATDVTGLEIYVGNSVANITYDVDGPGGAAPEPWGLGNDNLAFDGDGNLWVCQDAIDASDRNHIWFVEAGHTQASPKVKIFATTPVGCESTGLTFTPDYRFMFISFMNPNGSNTLVQTDAAGASVTFNTHTTVVVARLENLGNLATLPVSYTSFAAKLLNNETAQIDWSVSEIQNHKYFSLERSVNGTDFQEVYRNTENINGQLSRSFTYIDNNLPDATTIYYRIRQCDLNEECHLTEIKTVKRSKQGRIIRVFPQPASNTLNVQYYAISEGQASISVTDISGRAAMSETRKLNKGDQTLVLNTSSLPAGIYLVTVTDKDMQRTSQRFVKN